MSDSLAGQRVSATYGRVLQIANANDGADGTLRAVMDGKGDATPLYLSTASVGVGLASANYWTMSGAAAVGSSSIAEVRIDLAGSNTHIGMLFAAKGDGWFRARRIVAQATSLTPTSGALPAIQMGIVNGLTGTITSGVASAFAWQIAADTASASGATGGNLYYMNGLNTFGGTGMTGGRIGLNVSHSFGGGNSSNSSGSQYFHTGIQSQTVAAYRDGGIPNDHAGQLFGMFTSSELRPGGKYWNEVKGMEINVSIDRYASASRKLGLTITTATTDAEEGITEEAYIGIGGKKANATNSIGLRTGVLFGGSAGYWGIPASGALIEATPTTVSGGSPPAMTAAYGIDWSLVAFGGGFLRAANFAVDGSGNVGTNAVASGLTLQTLSGITAKSAGVASYTVLDGGIFTAIPTFTVAASPGGGTTATGTVATMGLKIIREIVTAGSGYAVDQILTISGSGTGTQATIRVTEVNGSGAILAAVMETAGSYSVLPSSPFSVSTGAATFRAGYSILTCALGTAGTLYPQFPAPIVTIDTAALIRRAKIMPVMTASNTALLLANGYANYLTVTGAASSSPTTVAAAGTDSNIYLRILGKGTSPTEALRMSVGTSSGSPALFDGTQAFTVRGSPTFATTFSPIANMQANMAGTSNASGQLPAFTFTIVDTLSATAATDVAGVAVYNTVNTGAKAPRAGLVVAQNLNGATTDAAGNENYWRGISVNSYANATAGGTSGTFGGNWFGGVTNALLQNGALYYRQLVGYEIGVAARTGSSVLYKNGFQIVQQAIDAVSGTEGVDSGLLLVSQPSGTAPGWDTAICIGHPFGWWPVKSSGTIMGTRPTYAAGPSYAATYGIDFSTITFSSGAFRSSGFLVDGSGNTTAASVIIGSSGPTIRSGTGAASGTQPRGSIWLRSDGGVGTTFYVSQGGGTWNAVAGV